MSSNPGRSPSDASSPAPLPVAEAIAAQDLNNLYLTSRYFADPVKYAAFCELYALMRVIDDRIDDLPLRAGLSQLEREKEHAIATAWERALFDLFAGRRPPNDLAQRCGRPDAGPLVAAAARAMHTFPFPPLLWRNFFSAMHRDIDQPRFASYGDFLAYTEGASVAPTTIYLYLIASQKTAGSDTYSLPDGFDLVACGRFLGLSSYLAHILRDMAQDLATGERGLLYLAHDDLERFGLDEAKLHRDLQRRQARPELRRLTAELAARARRASDHGARLLAPLDGRLTPDCAFILALIRVIYDRLLDKLESVSFDPFRGEHHLSLEEKRQAAAEVAERLGFPLASAARSPTGPSA